MSKEWAVCLMILCCSAHGAEVGKAPVPRSPYLPLIYKHADGLIEKAAYGKHPEQYQNLLRLFYVLSELSGKPKYREAADSELKKYLQNAPSEKLIRPWMLWDRCFDLDQAAAKDFAQQILQQATKEGADDLRRDGFRVRTFAVAFARTGEKTFLQGIEELLNRLDKQRFDAPAAALDRGGSRPSLFVSLAIDCDGAAHRVPEPLASRLRASAGRLDNWFCALPEQRKKGGGQIGMMCVSRYENTGKIAYRELMHAAADLDFNRRSGKSEDGLPMLLGHGISLQLAAWRSTAQQGYLDRARELADLAVEKFFEGKALLAAKGEVWARGDARPPTDTLALALVELHLHILHITAVRCPPNSIDR